MDPPVEIRDPVHGPIQVTPLEQEVLDHPLVQRLRRVRQLGFGELAFPGATHTRFLHSIGALYLAGRAFDSIARDLSFVPRVALDRLRATLRLAALLHDLGHPPLSHSGERILPCSSELGLAPPARPVTHEEMTRFLVLRSDLADRIDRAGRHAGVRADLVAAVLGHADPTLEPEFQFEGVSVLPILRQLIAGELDVDRMDYLVRDSHFTGVAYGRFDGDWLLSHLGAHRERGQALLALDSSAVFSFEDFLLSRFHMFLMVYSHHKTMVYHRMLERFLEGAGRAIRAPADPEGFARCDDEWLWQRLRDSEDPWARRIVEGRPLKRAVEVWDEEAHFLRRLQRRVAPLLPPFTEWMDSAVEFSKYFGRARAFGPARPPFPPPRLMVRMSHPGSRRAVVPFEESSDVFRRHARRRRVLRVYGPAETIQSIVDVVSQAVRDAASPRDGGLGRRGRVEGASG